MNESDKICTTVQLEVERILKTELVTIKKELDGLYKTVYKGNGSPSLMNQIATIDIKQQDLVENINKQFQSMSREQELKFDRVNEKLDSNFGRLEAWMQGQGRDTEKDINHLAQSIRDLGKEIDDYKKAEQTGKWQVKASALTALAGILTAAIAIYFGV